MHTNKRARTHASTHPLSHVVRLQQGEEVRELHFDTLKHARVDEAADARKGRERGGGRGGGWWLHEYTLNPPEKIGGGGGEKERKIN